GAGVLVRADRCHTSRALGGPEGTGRAGLANILQTNCVGSPVGKRDRLGRWGREKPCSVGIWGARCGRMGRGETHLKSAGRKPVWVRGPPPAPEKSASHKGKRAGTLSRV